MSSLEKDGLCSDGDDAKASSSKRDATKKNDANLTKDTESKKDANLHIEANVKEDAVSEEDTVVKIDAVSKEDPVTKKDAVSKEDAVTKKDAVLKEDGVIHRQTRRRAQKKNVVFATKNVNFKNADLDSGVSSIVSDISTGK